MLIDLKSYLCTKAIKSAALPEPSQTTTGTGGTSVTYSNTALIVFVPPSITRQTTGVLEWVTERKFKRKIQIKFFKLKTRSIF